MTSLCLIFKFTPERHPDKCDGFISPTSTPLTYEVNWRYKELGQTTLRIRLTKRSWIEDVWKRCQGFASSKASRSLLTKQTDVTCVLNIPLQCHKVFKLAQFKDDDQAQECLEFGFKADGCLLFQVWAVANFPLSGTVHFQIAHKKCVYRLQLKRNRLQPLRGRKLR